LGVVPLDGHDTFLVTTLAGRAPVVVDGQGRAVALDLDADRWLQLPALRARGYDTLAMRAFPTADGFVVFEAHPPHGAQRLQVHRFTPAGPS
jgi:hypothetical protein